MRNYQKLILTILLAPVVAGLVCAAPMGTAFNYQGYLTDKNGNPLTGQYDLKFDLYNVPSGGSSIATDTHAPVYVNKGLFTTNIDFGPGRFDGNAYWLEIALRPNGNMNNYAVQSPRVQIRPVPYALFASNAVNAATATTANTATTATTATTANGVSANAVGTAGLQDNSVTAAKIAANSVTAGKIAPAQVVKSLNGLFDNVSLQAGANVSLAQNANTLTISSSGGGTPGWSLTGNAGTTAGVNFLGTTDNQPLEFKANNSRVLRLEPVWSIGNDYSVNTIGGIGLNSVFNSAIGATIAGGGKAGPCFPCDFPNQVGADFGTIGGGYYNSVGGLYGTIPGGVGNEANGVGSFAAGQNAKALHDGSFVWGDGTGAALSRGPNRFDVRATGGASFYTGDNYLRVVGPFLQVSGGGGEEAYLGGDGAGGDIQLGSMNPTVSAVALYNAGNGTRMDLYVRALTITGGADLAEPFEMSDSDIPKGSVVIIDDEYSGRLKLSTEPYDRRVAGIVSGANGINPGLSLRQEGKLDSGENVALSGRVYVRADCANGAIKPGDLLTTSSTPGHAMKVTDHPRAQGAILGKAMSALQEGKGMVLVLVTLQ